MGAEVGICRFGSLGRHDLGAEVVLVLSVLCS